MSEEINPGHVLTVNIDGQDVGVSIPDQETSILLQGDFENCEQSRLLRLSFFRALAIDTKLPQWVRRMDGMSGRKYRILINSIVENTRDARYLEVGSWAGSTACSAIYGNTLTICCIDNWSEFGGPKTLFQQNIQNVLDETGGSVKFNFIEADFRSVNFSAVGKYNIYLFDGPHSEIDQYDGIAIAQPALDDIHILVVDDWNWEKVRKGTFRALGSLNIRVIASLDIRSAQDSTGAFFEKQHSDWHNGYFIALCQKP